MAASIVLNPGSDLRLGGQVSFVTSGYPRKVHDTLQRIEVLAYDDNGALIYGEAGASSDTFLLGGGGSTWRDRGGPAHCRANAYWFDNSGKVQTYQLVATTSFEAAG